MFVIKLIHKGVYLLKWSIICRFCNGGTFFMKNTNAFRTRAKDEIVKLEKDVYGRDVTHEEIEIVFLSYVMGFIKGLFVVARNTEGRIYEISTNPSNGKMYIDVYKKEGNKVVSL